MLQVHVHTVVVTGKCTYCSLVIVTGKCTYCSPVAVTGTCTYCSTWSSNWCLDCPLRLCTRHGGWLWYTCLGWLQVHSSVPVFGLACLLVLALTYASLWWWVGTSASVSNSVFHVASHIFTDLLEKEIVESSLSLICLWVSLCIDENVFVDFGLFLVTALMLAFLQTLCKGRFL